MKPMLSIIVPVFNLEDCLKKCLESILAQTYSNFELIVVNDGSTDKSGIICEEYARKDTRIKVIHKENGGLSSARNAGIETAMGEYLGFVDGDDWIFKDMYKHLMELCKSTESDIAICSITREEKGELQAINKENLIKEMDNHEAMKQLFKGLLYRFAAWNKLYKKKCFQNVRFPEGRIHEDLATTYRVIANAKKVVYTSYPGYVYVKRENSILTSQYNEKRLDAFRGWKEIIPFMDQHYPRLSNEYLSSFVYWSIDNVFYILTQVKSKKDKQKYLSVIQQCIRDYYSSILKKTHLTFRYKLLIRLLKHKVNLLILFIQFNSLLTKSSADIRATLFSKNRGKEKRYG